MEMALPRWRKPAMSRHSVHKPHAGVKWGYLRGRAYLCQDHQVFEYN